MVGVTGRTSILASRIFRPLTPRRVKPVSQSGSCPRPCAASPPSTQYCMPLPIFLQKGFADLSLQLVMAVPRLRDDGAVVREKVFRTIFITAV